MHFVKLEDQKRVILNHTVDCLQVAHLDLFKEAFDDFSFFEWLFREELILGKELRTDFHFVDEDLVLLHEVLAETFEIFTHSLLPLSFLVFFEVLAVLIITILPKLLFFFLDFLSLLLKGLDGFSSFDHHLFFSFYAEASALFQSLRS